MFLQNTMVSSATRLKSTKNKERKKITRKILVENSSILPSLWCELGGCIFHHFSGTCGSSSHILWRAIFSNANGHLRFDVLVITSWLSLWITNTSRGTSHETVAGESDGKSSDSQWEQRDLVICRGFVSLVAFKTAWNSQVLVQSSV